MTDADADAASGTAESNERSRLIDWLQRTCGAKFNGTNTAEVESIVSNMVSVASHRASTVQADKRKLEEQAAEIARLRSLVQDLLAGMEALSQRAQQRM